MNEHNILDEIKKEEVDPIYFQKSNRYLFYSLSSIVLLVVFWFLSMYFNYDFENEGGEPVFLFFLPILIAFIFDLLGLYNLVLSYRKREEKTLYQKIAFPISGFLAVIFLFILGAFIYTAMREVLNHIL